MGDFDLDIRITKVVSGSRGNEPMATIYGGSCCSQCSYTCYTDSCWSTCYTCNPATTATCRVNGIESGNVILC